MHGISPLHGGHREKLDHIQVFLHEQYRTLVQTEIPSSARRRRGAGSPHHAARRSDFERWWSMHSRREQPERDSHSVTLLFLIMVLVHVVIIAGLVIHEYGGLADLGALAAGIFLAWLLLKIVSLARRHLPRRRRATTRLRDVRPADRDIWL